MRLLMLGDSLVEFHHWQQRFPAHNVVNLGRAGETVAGLLARLPGQLAAEPPAEAILLMIGTNNLLAGDCLFLADYGEILTILARHSPESKRFASSLPPLSLPWLGDAGLARLNGLLADLARRRQARPLDLCAALRAAPLPLAACFAEDGIHLSEAGYEIWGDLIQTNL
jgi:lysophospholipase L1-like esterase